MARRIRKDGRYESTARVDGKKMHFYGATKREAQEKRDAYVELMDKCPLAGKKIRLGEWCEAWLETIRRDVSPQTLSSYTYLLKKHIVAAPIGQVLLVDLMPAQFRLYWQQLLDEGFSPRTVIYVHTITSEALKQAAMDGAIMYNPLVNVRRPKQVRKPAKAFTETQVKSLLASIEDPLFARIVRFALATGMRRGEILGLSWKDVDFERKTVSVNQSVIRKDGKEIISTDLKNASSRRTLSIDAATLEALRVQRAYDEGLKAQREDFSDLDLVFCREDGSPLRQNSVSVLTRKLFDAQGFEGYTFHSFRHTHATLLIKHGVNFKIVQYRLGHSTFQQTMDTYSHVTPDMEQDVVPTLEKII